VAIEATEVCGKDVSHMNIKNMYNSLELYAHSPSKKPLLTKEHIEARYKAAESWLQLENNDFKTIVFSDESKFNVFTSDSKCFNWCGSREALNPRFVCPTVKHGGGSVMVWGCFSYQGVGELVFIKNTMCATDYVSILSRSLPDSVRKMKLKRFIFQQDNDPKHTSGIVTRYLEEKGIDWSKTP